MSIDTYFYDAQLKRYVTQMLSIFTGLKVSGGINDKNDGTRLISVPVIYGSKDRVVAAIIAGNTQNKMLKLPIMSGYMSSLDLAPERRKAVNMERSTSYAGTNLGTFPDNIRVTRQLMPVPYNATIDLSIYSSSTEQQFEILEQILMMFDPDVQVQLTDGAFDWTKLTTIELVGINFNENYPMATDRRAVQTTLQFKVPIYISAPADVKANWIKTILLRIGVVSGTIDRTNISGQLDAEGVPYETIVSIDDFELPEA